MSAVRPLLLVLLLAALAAGCAASEDAGAAGGTGGAGGEGPGGAPSRLGGPLANAGADQRALEGHLVRLDGRGSLPAEDGRSLAFLWTQLEGPRVSLDDPTSPIAHFVAPPMRPREARRLVFLLTVDDGARFARDRVALELVDAPQQLAPAPVAVGGADQHVRPGDAVELGAPRTFDPACLEAGGALGCEEVALPYCWTQVDGPLVQLDGACDGSAGFVAPPFDAVLTFRLDAHRSDGTGTNRAFACGPELDDGQLVPPCATPDFVRILVRQARRLDRAPRAGFHDDENSDIPVTGGVAILGAGTGSYPTLQRLYGAAGDDEDSLDFQGYRPLVGEAPLMLPTSLAITLERDGTGSAGSHLGGLRTVGVAFESQAGRLRSAPAPAVLVWLPPGDDEPPQADAGDDPCSSGDTQGPCLPFLGGETVRLDGVASLDPDGLPAESLEFCWTQTWGPQVTFDEGSGCLRGVPIRTFVAPEAPSGGRALELAFQLVVRDGGPLPSRPDTAVVRIRPADNQPPDIVFDPPDVVDEQTLVVLDASASSDPDGGPLSFDWRQIWKPGAPQVQLLPSNRCGPLVQEGSCVEFLAPQVYADEELRFELAAADPAPVTSTQGFRITVRNSVNEPPSVEAGPDRIAAAASRVEVIAEVGDPNPDDAGSLVARWRVVSGAIVLESTDGPTTSFVAPEVGADHEVVLELSVTDGAGATTVDQVAIDVLAQGPYISPGGSDAGSGSRRAPVASIAKGLALAQRHGFQMLLLDGGTWLIDPPGDEPLLLEGIRLRGGHDASQDWLWPSPVQTRLETSRGVDLGEASGLESLRIEHVGGGDRAVRVRGAASLQSVAVEGRRLSGERTAAVEIVSGSLSLTAGAITGGEVPATGDATTYGVLCGDGASLAATDAWILGGRGPGRHTGLHLAAACTASVSGGRIEGGAALASGELPSLSIGVQVDGLGAPRFTAVDVIGGIGAQAVGARLRSGRLDDCTIRGGTAAERTGVDVPTSATGCSTPPCVFLEGGHVVGGSGAGGDAVGLRALSPVGVWDLTRLVGSEGDARTATGAQLLGGGVLSAARIRGVESGTADTALGVVAAGGATLDQIGTIVAGPARVEAVGIEARGAVEASWIDLVAGDETGASPVSVGARIRSNASLSLEGILRLEGGRAATTSRGVEVLRDAAGAGSLEAVNSLIFAGPAPSAAALHLAGPADVHSSLLAVRAGTGTRASAVLLASGAGLELRNVILDGGGGASDRAHLRDDGGGLPTVLHSVLFVPDPSCGTAGAHVRLSGGQAACSASGISSLGIGWSPIVADPLFVDPAGGDWHVARTSPAVDAGTADRAPALDADGRTRGGDGNADGVPGYDVGPFER